MKFFELKMRLVARLVVVCCFVCLGGAVPAPAQQQGFEGSSFPPPGWTFSGGPASLGGVANSTSGINPTEGVQYGWISVGCTFSAGTTCPGVATMTTPSYATLGLGTGAGLGSPTKETVLTSPSFTLTSSMQISFEVNFITTDGTTNFADFALVQLIPSTGSPIDLFVANTTAAGSAAVPPVDLNAGVGTMNPSTAFFSGTSVTFGATTYGNVPKFGGGPGGPTGWIQVTYMALAGTYTLQFSVSHVGDTQYPSALAIDDVKTSQVQSTSAATNPTTDTTVSTVFNSTQQVENDVILPPNNISTLTFPSGVDPNTLHFQSTNRIISNANPYTIGTPFALFVPFDHAGNDAMVGTMGHGAKYEVVCFDQVTHTTPSEANCPFPNPTAIPPAHIRAKDIFAFGGSQPTICTPGVACGTTVSFAHWAPFGNTGAPGTPGEISWAPSSTSPHPACPSPIVPANANTPPCNLEDILTNMSGDNGGGTGSDLKKGDYFLGYNVPMLLSAVKVNGTSVNTPGIQGSSPFFVHSLVTFDFNVAPAQCPAPPCGNGWVAAPVFNLFYHFDPLSSAPDYPNMLTDLNDLTNCPGTNCAVTAGTPGASSTANVKFTTTAMQFSEGQYLLQWSAADTVRIRERYIQLLPVGSQCPNPLGFSPAPMPPCYSTKLFNAQINVDNTPPTVTTPVLSPSPVNGTYAVGQAVTASVTCVDPVSGGVASGVVKCGKDSFTPAPTPPAGSQTPVNSSGNPVPTSTAGKPSFTLTGTDQAGNVGTSPAVSYCVGYTITSVDGNLVVGYTQPVANPPAVNLVGSSQAIPLSLTVTDCNGNFVSNLDLVGSTNVGTVKTVVLSATNAPSGTCASAIADNSISTAAAGSSGWQILGNGVYDYNWKPMAPVGSCLAFSVNLGDNVLHTAFFNVVRK